MVAPSSFKLLSAIAGLLLSTQLAHAATFHAQEDLYNIYCGPQPTNNELSAICFDANWDIRDHIKDSSPGLFGFMSQKNPDNFSVLVGKVGDKAEFSTIQHKVFLTGGAQNNKPCVVFSITDPDGQSNSNSGVFCVGDPHIHFP